MKTFSARETVWLQELDGIELAGFRRRAIAIIIDATLAGLALGLFATLFLAGFLGIRHLQGKPVHITDINRLNEVFGDKAQIKIAPDNQPPAELKAQPKAEPSAQAPPQSQTQSQPQPTTSPSATDEDTSTSPKSHIHYSIAEPEHEQPRTALAEAVHLFTDIGVPVLYFGLFLWQGNGRTPGKRLMKIRVVSLVHTHITFWHAVERALGYGAAALEGGFGFIQYFIHPYRRCAQDRLAETIVVTERSYQQKFPKALGTPSESDTALQ